MSIADKTWTTNKWYWIFLYTAFAWSWGLTVCLWRTAPPPGIRVVTVTDTINWYTSRREPCVCPLDQPADSVCNRYGYPCIENYISGFWSDTLYFFADSTTGRARWTHRNWSYLRGRR